MDPFLRQLLIRHATSGVLIDTNLLLMLVVGRYDRRRIETFKRTSMYALADFQRLGWLVAQFKKLWTTPNILTEVDNLGRQLPRREWKGFANTFRALTTELTEEVIPSSTAAKHQTFTRLGLCDTVTMSANRQFLLLSDDLNLYLAAQKAGIDAINFNHLRI